MSGTADAGVHELKPVLANISPEVGPCSDVAERCALDDELHIDTPNQMGILLDTL